MTKGMNLKWGGFGHSRSNVGKMTGALRPSNHTPEVAASITDTKGLPCVAIQITFQGGCLKPEPRDTDLTQGFNKKVLPEKRASKDVTAGDVPMSQGK